MTMDIHQRSLRTEVSQPFLPSVRASPDKSPSSTELPSAQQKPTKRSFDVAFLMAPDDLSTKKRQQQQQQLRLVTSASLLQHHSPPGVTFAPTLDSMELKLSRSLNQQRILTGRTNFQELPVLPTSPLGLLIPSSKNFQKVEYELKEPIIDMTEDDQSLQFAKSAFTKVKSVRAEVNGPGTPASPASVSSTMSGGGISPDVSYQESLSPPMMNNSSRSPVNYLQSSKPLNPNMAYFASGGKMLPQLGPGGGYYYNSSRDKSEGKPSSPVNNGFTPNFITKPPTDPMQKLRPMLYQNEGLPYPGLPVTSYPFPPSFPSSGGPVPTAHTLLTAAASVTAAALLPSSLAALTLPAQNVCAKCKISFRMTSDLVYHMRSHHKGEHMVADTVRRRRDLDKLRCPVCNETFRERHHLTRHMTAHQDKEGDQDDEDDALELTKRRVQQK